MKGITTAFLLIALFTSKVSCQETRFNMAKDLLLVQYDCKTDVDDLHTVAAFATLMAHPNYSDVQYHAVAGTYGIQDGLYVPAEELFQMAFHESQWSDAHNEAEKALNDVLKKVQATLNDGGDIWVADAGQSDFSAKWIEALRAAQPQVDAKKRIHVVQHSNWNEEVTAPDLLQYVKETVDYHKIPDGNAVGNGTPGFRSDEKITWEAYLKESNDLKKLWRLAISIGDRYNGREGRYLNESIAAGGLDFSDLSETCYIFNLEQLRDANAFFEMVSNR